MADEDKDTFELTQVELDSMGLVERAAVGKNGRNFLLFKSADNHPEEDRVDELEIEEVEQTPDPDPVPEPEPEPAWLPRVVDAIKAAMGGRKQKPDPAMMKAVQGACKILQGAGFKVTPEKMMGMLDGDGMEDEEEENMEMACKKPMKKEGEEPPAAEAVEPAEPAADEPTEEEPMTEELVKMQQEAIAAIQKAADERVAATATALKAEYEAQLSDLKGRIEKAEAEADRAGVEREQREYLEKAMTFRALPTRHTELGAHLHKLAKSVEAEEYDWWYNLVKAADAQLGASQIFAEMGTARSPEELVLADKVSQIAKAENISEAEAMFRLSEVEQAQLLNEMRGGK